MTTAPRVDPIPAEVAKIIARTADRIEGVAAINRPAPSPRAWRVDAER